jgi:hypothetical protein
MTFTTADATQVGKKFDFLWAAETPTTVQTTTGVPLKAVASFSVFVISSTTDCTVNSVTPAPIPLINYDIGQGTAVTVPFP